MKDSSLFRNGTIILAFLKAVIDSQKAERYISIRFYSISESEHRYLYAMSSALDFDAENFIYAVPLIPNNIKGGIGIFSIANQVKYKLKEENCQDRY